MCCRFIRTYGTITPKRRGTGSIQPDSCCDIDQMTDCDVSQSSSTLLPRRSKQPRHKTTMDQARRRRAHTAPQEGSLSCSSSSSSLAITCSSGEESNRSSYQGQRPSTGTYSCHISCRVSPDKPGYFEYLRPYSVFRSPLKRARSVPKSFSDSYHLQHPDLSKGQKTYLWHTAAVYSVSNMKSLQERRYKQLLQHQVDIGFHTQEECDRYLSYLLGTRKRQYIADPSVWRDPPKIPVRQKSFHLPPPLKSQSPRDYRFFPRGYEDYQKGQEDSEKGNTDGKCQEQTKDQPEARGHTHKGKGQAEGQSQSEVKDQSERGRIDEGRVQTEGNGELDKDGSHQQIEDPHSASDEEQSLSESMQGMSLYYDPKRKTTVTRGQKEEDGESRRENVEGEGSQKSPKISHQNCFWGSH